MQLTTEQRLKQMSDAWWSRDRLYRGRACLCPCGRSIFFDDSECRGCGAPLGYDPLLGRISALEIGPGEGTFHLSGENRSSLPYRRCGNFDTPARCNWLLLAEEELPHYISCRLNRTIPDLGDADNRRYWAAIERAKRRLISQMLAIGVPVESKVSEDPQRGLAFDFLRCPPTGPRVMTGHASGLITLNVEEADDATREKIRHDLHEPYRTLVGHFRHEVGHYYWDRLILGTVWHEPCRALFGDERADYAAALKVNYERGPPPDWTNQYISAYASAHPWEDWAESWAHCLHLLDSLDTALGFGFTGENVEAEVEQFTVGDLYAPDHPDAEFVLSRVNSWLLLTTVLNELARSMGQPDFYPFVMSRTVLRKLHFIYLVIRDEKSYAAGR